ncbi:MAG: Hsp20 family protein [Novosphingobium sp.]
MNRIDFSPYRRTMVGFDRLFDMIESQGRANAGDKQANLLIVKGNKPEDSSDGEFLHVGIAQRGFERRFELADYVRVDSADLADGLLIVDLVREVPEAMKPKKIAIGGNTLTVVENGSDEDTAAA